MSIMRALRYLALGLSLAYAFPAACGNGGLVGGECKDPDCNPAAAAAANGGGGKSSKPMGGSSNNGAEGPGEAGNGAAAAPQGGDGELTDGGFFDSPVDGQSDAGPPLECLPPYDSSAHCGECDKRCLEPTPLCAPDGAGSFECVPECVPPLVKCQGQCLDPESFNSDPDNCGSCGHECPSDICQEGECVGARFGHIALLCLDLGSAMADSTGATVLGNAVNIPRADPIKVLAYTRGARAAAVSRINTLIDAQTSSVQITEAKTAAAVTEKLNINDYQVFLIHDLDQAPSGEPAAIATTWASSSVLSSFARAGGVIVVLDGGDGTGEMNELITASNLLDPSGQLRVSGQTDITGQSIFNGAPSDVLGTNDVLSKSLASSHTCRFDTDAVEDDDVTFVLTDEAGDPVAIHRVVVP